MHMYNNLRLSMQECVFRDTDVISIPQSQLLTVFRK